MIRHLEKRCLMAKRLEVRELTPEEQTVIERLVHARTASVRAVERARIIWLSSQRRRVAAIAEELRCDRDTVRLWLKRFNAAGLAGLVDAPRSGHPPTYSAEQVSEVLAASLTTPTELGQPFASWTLDRLEVYLNEEKGIPIKRSRIDDLLLAEGLRWRTQEGWFGERAGQENASDQANPERETPVDPAFAQKRGRLSRSTRRRRRVA
jgi:transposase